MEIVCRTVISIFPFLGYLPDYNFAFAGASKTWHYGKFIDCIIIRLFCLLGGYRSFC